MGTLWEGRMSGDTEESLRALNDSLQIDKRLYKEDISGSAAHVQMLVSVGLIEESDGKSILEALEATEEEISSGSFILIKPLPLQTSQIALCTLYFFNFTI